MKRICEEVLEHRYKWEGRPLGLYLVMGEYNIFDEFVSKENWDRYQTDLALTDLILAAERMKQRLKPTSKDLRQYGYVMGFYTCKCALCGAQFSGAKKSVVCRQCAVKKWHRKQGE